MTETAKNHSRHLTSGSPAGVGDRLKLEVDSGNGDRQSGLGSAFAPEENLMPAAEPASARQERLLSDRIIRNVIFGGLRSVLVAPVPFLLTPLILTKIGAGGYGTWAVFLAING